MDLLCQDSATGRLVPLPDGVVSESLRKSAYYQPEQYGQVVDRIGRVTLVERYRPLGTVSFEGREQLCYVCSDPDSPQHGLVVLPQGRYLVPLTTRD